MTSLPESQPSHPPSAETADAAPSSTLSPAALSEERVLLARALGGWRGVLDSSLPAIVFLTVYLLTSRLVPALIAAVAAAVVVAVIRLARRQPVTQAVAGFVGVGIAALFAWRSGEASDYFLPGLLINIGYCAVFLVSVLIGRPVLGYGVGFLLGDATGWRRDPHRVRAYAAASWMWVGVFIARIAVQTPLYLAGAVGALGAARLVMGWPMFLLAAWVTYRVLAPVVRPSPPGDRQGSPPEPPPDPGSPRR